MRSMTSFDMLEAYAKLTGKPCMYISFSHDDIDEVVKAAPYLNFKDHAQHLLDGYAYLAFDSVEERDSIYRMTVGDDGPTDTNPYDGPARVYALTAGPNGLENENT